MSLLGGMENGLAHAGSRISASRWQREWMHVGWEINSSFVVVFKTNIRDGGREAQSERSARGPETGTGSTILSLEPFVYFIVLCYFFRFCSNVQWGDNHAVLGFAKVLLLSHSRLNLHNVNVVIVFSCSIYFCWITCKTQRCGFTLF